MPEESLLEREYLVKNKIEVNTNILIANTLN